MAAVDTVGMGWQGPPPASALASVSLKPQWAQGKCTTAGDEKKPGSDADLGKLLVFVFFTFCFYSILLCLQCLSLPTSNLLRWPQQKGPHVLMVTLF